VKGNEVMLGEPKPPDPETIADAHRLAAAGADGETILVFLRDRKFDKIDSIKTIRLLSDLSMPEAKDLVDRSVAWSDRFYSDMEFRERAMRALRDIAAANAKNPNAIKIRFTEPDEADN